MTSRIQKRLLLANRVRRPPLEGFSWVDRRFLQDYAARLSRDAILLYFFLTAVSDQQGLSLQPPVLHRGGLQSLGDLFRSAGNSAEKNSSGSES